MQHLELQNERFKIRIEAGHLYYEKNRFGVQSEDGHMFVNFKSYKP